MYLLQDCEYFHLDIYFIKAPQFLLATLLFPVVCLAQKSSSNAPIEKLQTIDKSIYRIIFTSPLSPNREINTLAFNFEHQIKNAVTIDVKLGVGINKFGKGKNVNQCSFHGFGSVEGKYYLFPKDRKKWNRYIYTFTSPYVSIGQNVRTNEFALINQVEKEAFEGATATFFHGRIPSRNMQTLFAC
ncbi:MAG: hypothetical protein ACKVOM_09115 [Ferruginibacter sp.]